MIEFNGRLTGEANARFFEKTRTQTQKISSIVMLVFFGPVSLIQAFKNHHYFMLTSVFLIWLMIFLSAYIPLSTKEKEKIIPRRVFIYEGVITSVSNKQQVSNSLDKVKEVLDCKTYYEIVFGLGESGVGFICQKDLLSQGTLEEFEALFEGKMTDLTGYFD